MRKIYSLSLYSEKDISYCGWETDSTKLVTHTTATSRTPGWRWFLRGTEKSDFFCWPFAPCECIQPALNWLQNWKKGKEGWRRVLKHFFLFVLFKGYISIYFGFCQNLKNNKPHWASWDYSPHSPYILITREGKQHFTAPVESKLVFLATKCSISSTIHTHTHCCLQH